MSDTADAVSAADPELVEVFRDFETAIWAHINAPDTPEGVGGSPTAVAAELGRVQGAVDTELQIVS